MLDVSYSIHCAKPFAVDAALITMVPRLLDGTGSAIRANLVAEGYELFYSSCPNRCSHPWSQHLGVCSNNWKYFINYNQMELQQLVVIFSWSTKYLLVLALQIWFDKTLNIFKFWTVGPIKQDIWTHLRLWEMTVHSAFFSIFCRWFIDQMANWLIKKMISRIGW